MFLVDFVSKEVYYFKHILVLYKTKQMDKTQVVNL